MSELLTSIGADFDSVPFDEHKMAWLLALFLWKLARKFSLRPSVDEHAPRRTVCLFIVSWPVRYHCFIESSSFREIVRRRKKLSVHIFVCCFTIEVCLVFLFWWMVVVVRSGGDIVSYWNDLRIILLFISLFISTIWKSKVVGAYLKIWISVNQPAAICFNRQKLFS